MAPFSIIIIIGIVYLCYRLIRKYLSNIKWHPAESKRRGILFIVDFLAGIILGLYSFVYVDENNKSNSITIYAFIIFLIVHVGYTIHLSYQEIEKTFSQIVTIFIGGLLLFFLGRISLLGIPTVAIYALLSCLLAVSFLREIQNPLFIKKIQ